VNIPGTRVLYNNRRAATIIQDKTKEHPYVLIQFDTYDGLEGWTCDGGDTRIRDARRLVGQSRFYWVIGMGVVGDLTIPQGKDDYDIDS